MSVPRNNYFLWLKENRDNIKTMYFADYEVKIVDGKKENISTLITKKAGEVWRSLDNSIKEKYTEKLNLLKATEPIGNTKEPKSKKNISGINEPSKISDKLCKFLKVDKGTEIARSDVTKHITQYIKTNSLQDPENKRIILVDNKLGKLLGVDKTSTEVTYFLTHDE